MPACFRSTAVVKDVVSEMGESLWRWEYYEALDLVTSEIECRFDQAGMTIATQRKQILMDSTKGTVCTKTELKDRVHFSFPVTWTECLYICN